MDKNPLWSKNLPFLTEDIVQIRILWSIRLRWLSLGGFFFSSLILKYNFELPIPYNKVWLLLVTLSVINIIYYVILKLSDRISLFTKLVVLQIHAVIDLIFLTLILHWTGGIENPLYLFYVFHVVISSIIFPGWIPVALATFVVFLFGSLVYMEYAGILYHYSIFNINIHTNKLAVLLVLSVFTITVYVSTYICTTFMVIYRDIKLAIDQKNQQLIEVDRQKTQFFQYTSHELKSPIIAVKSSIDSICKNYQNSMDNRAINILNRASKRCEQMLNIIKELLILSNNRSQVSLKKIEDVDINKILKTIIQQENAAAQHKNVKINSKFDPDLLLISGSVSDFEKIFTNLISNAVRYNKDNGNVYVSTKSLSDKIEIQVKDTGIGIPENDLSKVFAEFYRSENARKIINFGTGLGLSLVKQIIENYNGNIKVKSAIDEGTTFTIQIPLNKIGGKND